MKKLIMIMAFIFLLFLPAGAEAVDEYVYGLMYFNIELSTIDSLNVIEKGMEWIKWNWSLGAGITITECILYEGTIQIEEFNTSLATWNRTILREGRKYNLSCRGYSESGAGAWASITETTKSLLEEIRPLLKIAYIRKLLMDWMGGDT